MNITRVERDGVEFFTIDATGESGMSESGLARLCGVAPSSVHRFVSNSAVRWDHEKTLDPKFRKTISFCAGNGENSSQKSNIKVLSATVCARTIEYFAFDTKYKTEEALFAYRKFAVKGINAWIQEATHWHGNPVPKNRPTSRQKTGWHVLPRVFDFAKCDPIAHDLNGRRNHETG
jgi:hypothetical protein